MIKKSTLTKDAVLWGKGDAARCIGILESGRLGVRDDSALLGVVLPGMALGETAIQTLEGDSRPRRTATVFALEDNTVVTEYPVFMVKQMFASSKKELPLLILKTIIGHISRNCLILMSVNRDRPAIRLPMRGLLAGVLQAGAALQTIASWEEFLKMLNFLSMLRDDVSKLRVRSPANALLGSEALDKISSTMKELYPDQDLGIDLESFFRAECDPYLLTDI